MADDPLMGYQSPSSDPLMGYKPPAATTPPDDPGMATRMARWLVGANDPQTVLEPRSLSQAASDVSDFGRVAANTFGLGDRMLASARTSGFQPDPTTGVMTSINDPVKEAAALASAQADTKAAAGRIGPVGSGVANAVGYGPMGALGVAGRLGGGIIGTGVEGALGGGLAAAGHGDNVTAGAAEGGGLGLGVGTLTRIANPILRYGMNKIGSWTGLLDKPADVASQTASDAAKAYNAADKIKFDPDDVNQAYRTAKNSLDPSQQRDLSSSMNTTFDSHLADNLKMSGVSADDMDGFARSLQGQASTPGDSVLAARIKSNLNDVMGSATPVSNHAVGDGLDAITAARQAHATAANAQTLSDMRGNLDQWQANPGNEAMKNAKQWAQPDDEQWNAWKSIYNASGGNGQSVYNVMHMLDPVAGFVGASAAGGPGALAAEVGMHALKPTIGGALGKLTRQGIRGAISDAYPALTGYQTSYSPDIGAALRAATLGSAAAKGY